MVYGERVLNKKEICELKAETQNIKIISVIVSPAHSFTSGAVTAGISLSQRIGKKIQYETLIMGRKNKVEHVNKKFKIRTFHCINKFNRIPFLPQYIKNAHDECPEIEKFINKNKPALVHFHNVHPAKSLWKFSRVCIKNNIPYVLSSHGFIETFYPAAWIRKSALKIFLFKIISQKYVYKSIKNASSIFYTSPEEFAIFKKIPNPKALQFIVPNGYDPYFRQKPNKKIINSLKRELKIEGIKKPVLFFLGNHVENKGIDLLLKACHHLEDKCLVLIGGRIKSLHSHTRLLNQCCYDKIKHFVKFLGYLPKNKLRALYHSVDAFVYPTRSDTSPLVILDAMIARLPIIASKVGGIPFQIKKCGILIPSGNIKILANAIKTLIKSESKRKVLSSYGFTRCKKMFSWSKSAKQSILFYKKIIQKRKK